MAFFVIALLRVCSASTSSYHWWMIRKERSAASTLHAPPFFVFPPSHWCCFWLYCVEGILISHISMTLIFLCSIHFRQVAARWFTQKLNSMSFTWKCNSSTPMIRSNLSIDHRRIHLRSAVGSPHSPLKLYANCLLSLTTIRFRTELVERYILHFLYLKTTILRWKPISGMAILYAHIPYLMTN